jgi:hypothetical protein
MNTFSIHIVVVSTWTVVFFIWQLLSTYHNNRIIKKPIQPIKVGWAFFKSFYLSLKLQESYPSRRTDSSPITQHS